MQQIGESTAADFSPRRFEVSVVCGSRVEFIDPMQGLCARIFEIAGFDDEASYWPVLAVREAVMNAVLHGNEGRPEAQFTVDYRVTDDRVEISVCDQGKGFIPAEVADPLAADNRLTDSGRGVFLINKLMDEVSFSQPSGGGTCIRRVKHRPDRVADGDSTRAAAGRG